MKLTEEMFKQVNQAANAEELLALAKENGLELCEEDAKKFFSERKVERALSDDELENVGGGLCSVTSKPDPHKDGSIKTRMQCDNCGYWCDWKGNYADEGRYKCPQCLQKSFVGIYTAPLE